MKTMLQIIQAATQQLGIPSPNLVVGSTTQDTIQLLALLNQLGDDLQRDYIWEALCTSYRFTTSYLTTTGTTTTGSAIVTAIGSTTGLDSTYQVVGTGINTDTYAQTLDSATQVTMTQAATGSGTVSLTFSKIKYTMPSDYDRIEDRTQWDKTQHWEMLGPETAQMWQWLLSGYIATGPRIHWRIFGSYFQIWPAFSSAEYLGFEYISNAWARSSAGVAKTSFTADTDVCIYPDGLMITGLKMMYQQAKGLGMEFVEQYENLLSIAKANDAGSADLHMGPRPYNILLGWNNIPDTSYGP